MSESRPERSALDALLRAPEDLAIALSGGVDSLTLSAAALDARGAAHLTFCHAISPAVPAEATSRVRAFATARGAELRIFDAGEFADPRYLANPVNRCYFCKTNLYSRIVEHMPDVVVASGTNLDDIGDFRPGLRAAEERQVFHPFVQAAFRESDIRRLARALGLGDLAELPASPCLASRVETGLPILGEELQLIDAVEETLRSHLGAVTLRCRRRAGGLVVELDPDLLSGLTQDGRNRLAVIAAAAARGHGSELPLSLEPYRRGSAFLHD